MNCRQRVVFRHEERNLTWRRKVHEECKPAPACKISVVFSASIEKYQLVAADAAVGAVGAGGAIGVTDGAASSGSSANPNST